MGTVGMWRLLTVVALTAGIATNAVAQQPEPRRVRRAIEQEQAEKAQATSHPYTEQNVKKSSRQTREIATNGAPKWHPFFYNAYSGGGFEPVSANRAPRLRLDNLIDVRGSYSIKDYKRIEAEFIAPRLFRRVGAS